MSPSEFQKCVKKIQELDTDMTKSMAMFFIFEYSEDLKGSSPQRIWSSLSFVKNSVDPFSTAKFYAIRAKLFKHCLENLQPWKMSDLQEIVNE